MLITLLTDFGRRDGYAGALEGVIHRLAPGATVAHISHEIPAQDVAAGAFVLAQAWPYFPPGTVHLAVVDPGVGSARRGLAVRAGGHFFVAPDNGLLSSVLASEPQFEARELTEPRYWLPHPSRTFHGRDIFAPVAAHLAAGTDFARFGPAVRDPVRFSPHRTQTTSDGWAACILHIDHFGNLVTQLTPQDLPARPPAGWRIRLGEWTIAGVRETYADAAEGELLAYWGSAGYLEVAVRGGSAAAQTGARRGDMVWIHFKE